MPTSTRAATRTPRRKGVSTRLIEADRDINDGVKALRRLCPVMKRVYAATGDPPLRRRRPGFEGLARIIVAQQLSVASANAIWDRFAGLVRPLEAHRLLARADDELRAVGLSRPKIRTLRAMSEAVVDGLDLAKLRQVPEQEVHARLTAISGIGPWTADIYLMFCVGHADAFAKGDLALQIAAQMAFPLDQRPSADELEELAERWRPWRGVAARLLWAYYKVIKDQKSGNPV